MANAQVEVKLIEFVINPEETICNLFYTSNEPGTPWGGGWKNKSFPKEKNIADFINEEVGNYLDWNNGKQSGQFK